MIIGLFLPHVGIFGGVRRYIELGNAWTALGHRVTLYHPDGVRPAWLSFAGEVATLEAAARRESDAAICSDPHTYPAFRAHRAATHLYYCVLERDPGLPRAARDRDVLLAANSTPLRRTITALTRRPVLDGAGGINLAQFHPDPRQRAASPLRVLVNGRRSRAKKGTDLVLAALRSLASKAPAFEVVLFDSASPNVASDPRDGAPLPAHARYVLGPTQTELAALYQSSHVFVAAERKAGWCNTALEAMASGCAVACTRSGTTDFARDGSSALVIPFRHPWFIARAVRRLLDDPALRARLEAEGPRAALPWTWDRLASKLADQLTARPASTEAPAA